MSTKWLDIKRYLDNHCHDDIVKGIIAHFYEFNNNELDTIYLMYMDNDNIVSIFNKGIIRIIDKVTSY